MVRQVREQILQTPAHAVQGRGLLLDLLDDRSSGIGHRSLKEQRVGRWLNEAGLRGWHRNYKVPVGHNDFVEVDFAWLGPKVDLEVSPYFTHWSKEKQERDVERRRLLVAHGWRIVEATDLHLVDQRSFGTTVSSLTALGVSDCALSSSSQSNRARK